MNVRYLLPKTAAVQTKPKPGEKRSIKQDIQNWQKVFCHLTKQGLLVVTVHSTSWKSYLTFPFGSVIRNMPWSQNSSWGTSTTPRLQSNMAAECVGFGEKLFISHLILFCLIWPALLTVLANFYPDKCDAPFMCKLSHSVFLASVSQRLVGTTESRLLRSVEGTVTNKTYNVCQANRLANYSCSVRSITWKYKVPCQGLRTLFSDFTNNCRRAAVHPAGTKMLKHFMEQ